jgi:hypothetical protein
MPSKIEAKTGLMDVEIGDVDAFGPAAHLDRRIRRAAEHRCLNRRVGIAIAAKEADAHRRQGEESAYIAAD